MSKYPVEPYTKDFWEAAESGRFVVQYCPACKTYQMYPRRSCVNCGSQHIEYRPVSGRGKLYSFATIVRNATPRFAADMPYTLAIVELEEGPRMLTRIVDTSDDQLGCDMPVMCVFRRFADGRPLPCFVPASGDAK